MPEEAIITRRFKLGAQAEDVQLFAGVCALNVQVIASGDVNKYPEAEVEINRLSWGDQEIDVLF